MYSPESFKNTNRGKSIYFCFFHDFLYYIGFCYVRQEQSPSTTEKIYASQTHLIPNYALRIPN